MTTLMKKITFTRKSTPEFVEWLTSRRNDKGWSISELARQSGVSRIYIHQIISGKKGITLNFCYLLAVVFCVSITEVLDIAGYKRDFYTPPVKQDEPDISPWRKAKEKSQAINRKNEPA